VVGRTDLPKGRASPVASGVMTDWTALAAAVLPALGLVFAGWQVMQGNRQARQERRLGLMGVVVYWRPDFAPHVADGDGSAVWRYMITVANPGKFPIDNVAVTWTFAFPVQRVRSDGQLDPATEEIPLSIPVLPGGGEHTWNRTLRMNFAEASRLLPHTHAKVAFNDIKGTARENRWPRPAKTRARQGR
jgi:hypothetical protein